MKRLLLLILTFIIIGSCKPTTSKNDTDNLNRLAAILSASKSQEPRLRIVGNAKNLDAKSLPNTVMRMDSKRISSTLSVKDSQSHPPPPPKELRFIDYSLSPNKLKGTILENYKADPNVQSYEIFWMNTDSNKMKKFTEVTKTSERLEFTFEEIDYQGNYNEFFVQTYDSEGRFIQSSSTMLQDTKDGAITDENGNFEIYCTHSKLYTTYLDDAYRGFGHFEVDLSTAKSASDLSNIAEDVKQNGVESFVNQYVLSEGFILKITGVYYEGPTPTNETEYSIGGSITGLNVSGLVLQNNGGDDLNVASGATSFTFPTKVNNGDTYNVTVLTQPTGQNCTVENGSGTANSDIASVSVICGSDGTIWTQRTLPASQGWQSVAYGNGTFVAVGGTTTAATSADGSTWTSSTLPINGFYVGFGNNRFVVVQQNSTNVATSTDGINWTTGSLPVSAEWYGVGYGNGTFVTFARTTIVAATSTDGINWTQRTLPSSADWRSIAYGNNTFVITPVSNNVVATSTDGITWIQRTLPVTGSWNMVTFGNGIFVTVGDLSTTALISTDGINWTQGTLPSSLMWRGITYGNGIFVTPAYDTTTVATSTDGITWTSSNSLPSNPSWYTGVGYGGGVFVFLGSNSTIAASSP